MFTISSFIKENYAEDRNDEKSERKVILINCQKYDVHYYWHNYFGNDRDGQQYVDARQFVSDLCK